MFERFTRAARLAVIDAQEEARNESAAEIRPEHLLLAVLGSADPVVGDLCDVDAVRGALRDARRRAGLSDADVRALAAMGIDADRIVESVEGEHGPGALAAGGGRRPRRARAHIPFAASAKRALELSLTEATQFGDRHIGVVHLVLALSELPGLVADVLAEHGVTPARLRRTFRHAG